MDVDSTGDIYITTRGAYGSIVKYNTNGQLLWSDTVNGVKPNFETKYSVLSKSGKLYVIALGWITQSQAALFLIKYNSSGNRLWIKTYFDTTTPTPDAFILDEEENMYVAGTVTQGGYNIGYTKYDSSGNYKFSRYYYNPIYYWYNYGTAIALDSLKNIYVAGYVNVDPPYAHYNSVITKYDFYGNQKWTNIFNDTSVSFSSKPVNIVCDKGNNIYIGINSHRIDYKDNIVILKYSNNGILLKQRDYSDRIYDNTLISLKGDKNNNIYLALMAGSSVSGIHESVVLKYDSTVTKIWENRYISTVTNTNIPDYLHLDNSGNAYVTGGLNSYKLNYQGNLIWVVEDSTITNGDYFFGQVIKTDYQNNVLIFGNVPNTYPNFTDFVIIKKNSQTVYVSNQNQLVSNYKLYQNYPNPFNPSTNIKYTIPDNGKSQIENGLITLKIYDILGREIATLINEKQSPGIYAVSWNGAEFPSGIYFYKIIAGDVTETKKMFLLK
ncbi:MAG: T9SS type A sorting domain-containing protein [Ignavibacteriae bacterium]|nr:T9SS type A sorting domain-containing protein [Ignavibacteriota bacterium]